VIISDTLYLRWLDFACSTEIEPPHQPHQRLVTTILKFIPLVVIGIVGLFSFNSANFTPFAPNGAWSGINAGAALTLWAFIGLESATIPAEEVHDPERTIPRATIIGTVAATLIYLLTTLAIMGIIPTAALAQSTSPFADAAGIIFGNVWATRAIALIAMISAFGCLNGWILLQGRVPFAAAQMGYYRASSPSSTRAGRLRSLAWWCRRC